ncbi:MAG: tRNA threonylcarbamoyladenosine dehydratase [Desulfitobacteriaceae bacterium]|nr:tRNA threonylcarbamoyladenosine dehydratase [Desulfitobacteriaceae bacterium]MDD4752599.1 tRNA threonylcarbamoyladenosine dehydratase [Desulfitobacteriaceae bacterium]
MNYEFSRTEMLIGKEYLKKLKESKVAVFGIGGVGSFVVEGLVRAGVGHLVLIDHDDICPTNINRQLHATGKTVGRAKVEVMKERVLEINPQAEVIIHQKLYLPDCSGELIKLDYNYIVDAIDMVTAKIDLVVKAKQMGIPIISSMGTGNKMDPTKFEVADIFSTSVCPLAKVMRKELRKRGIDSLQVVYSKEEPIKPEKIQESGSVSSEETAVKSIARRQTPGSISFVPSVAGLIIAGQVVKDLISRDK